MGIKPNTFWKMTPKEFWAVYDFMFGESEGMTSDEYYDAKEKAEEKFRKLDLKNKVKA